MQISRERIQELVCDVVAERLNINVEKIMQGKGLDQDLIDDLGADSLDLVETVMGMEEAIEEELKQAGIIEIGDEDAEKATTPQKIIDILADLLTKAGVEVVEQV